jgi:type I restriction enzyme S subunit
VTPRLRHLAEINPATPEFDNLRDDAEVAFLPLEAIWPGDHYDPSRRRQKEAVSTGYTRFVEGDILLPKITPTFQADRVVIAKNIGSGIGAATTEVHVVRVGHRADTRYVRYLLSSKSFLDEGEASMLGVAGQKRVPDEYLRDLRVPVTEVLRQCAIADYLDTETAHIDALIAKKDRMVKLLKERRDVVVTASVRGQHTHAHHIEDSMDEVRPLRSYAEVALGRQRSPQHEIGVHMVPYLRAANVKDGELMLDDVKEMNFTPAEQQVFALRAGDVLVTEGSGSLGTVGASAVWSEEIAGVVCFQNTLLRLRSHASTDPRFLAWWCRSAFASGLFASVAEGANIFHLSAERVRALPMTRLSLHLQRTIADFLDIETARIDRLAFKLRSQIDLLAERRLALITVAVTGELDIPGTRE